MLCAPVSAFNDTSRTVRFARLPSALDSSPGVCAKQERDHRQSCRTITKSNETKQSMALDVTHRQGPYWTAGFAAREQQHCSCRVRQCDSERLDANRVRTAPTELLPATTVTSNDSQCRALGGDRQARRPFADRMITDGFGGHVQRRGVAPRQEHGSSEPEGGRRRLDVACPLRHHEAAARGPG